MKQRDVTPTRHTPERGLVSSDPVLKEAAAKAAKVLETKVDEFLSAEELKQTNIARDALIKTLELMEAGKLQHASNQTLKALEGRFESLKLDDGKLHFFRMQTWHHKQDCGSVCCIGGSAEAVAGRGKLFNYDGDEGKNLYELFHPGGRDKWDSITPKLGAKALRNYLETGKADWKKVMEG